MTNYSLKLNTVEIKEVDALTYAGFENSGKVGLDKYIAQCYGLEKDFEILEASNDTHSRFTVEGIADTDTYNLGKANEAIADGYVEIHALGTVLDKMVNDGFLEPGTYLVKMSW